MNKVGLMNFEVDKANKKINVERSFDAPLSIVWDAWTRPEILDQWWAPKPWKAVTKEMQFKEGGFWHYYMLSPDGKEKHWCLFEYQEIRNREKYVGEDAFCDEKRVINETKPRMTWHVSFSGNGNSTSVSIRIDFIKAEDIDAIIEMGFKEGFAMGMTNLDELLPSLKK